MGHLSFLPLACLLVVLFALVAPALPVPATHGPIVPVMEIAAQNTKPGIRPGAWMESPAPCTFAFVVEDGQDRLYITTAGHCVNHVGQSVTIREEGEIGTVVAFRDAGARHDYALIEIHEEKHDRVDPTMIGWGGPTGLYTGGATGSQTLKHYGWGAGTWYDHSTRCRAGVAPSLFWTSETFRMYGTVLFGDSGSGTMTEDGRALGINTHLSPHPGGVSTGPRFDHVLERLSGITGLSLSLVEGRAVNDVCDMEM